MKKALGLLEVKGLASAICVADVMIKSAAIELVGVEKAKGSGWMTVKVVGDVGAVKASVEAGEAQAWQDKSFVSSKVIPRPGEGITEFFLTCDYGGQTEIEKKELVEEVQIPEPEKEEVKETTEEVVAEKIEEVLEKEPVKIAEEVKPTPKPVQEPPKIRPNNAKGPANNKKPPSKGGKK